MNSVNAYFSDVFHICFPLYKYILRSILCVIWSSESCKFKLDESDFLLVTIQVLAD